MGNIEPICHSTWTKTNKITQLILQKELKKTLKMYNNKKREYTSPEMEVLDARVERGFQASSASANTLSNPIGNDSYARGGEIGNNFD